MPARKIAKKPAKKRRAVELPPVESTLDMSNIIPSIAGDYCPKRLLFGPFVKEACDYTPHKACCLSCSVQLPSLDIIQEHVRTGTHVLARVCSTHGAEEWR